MTLEDIIKGEIDCPDVLYEFLSHVIFGYDRRNRESSIKKRRVNSIAQGIIYATTGGAVKPAKQLLMGLAFKSMTGSRRIIEILNRLGHSISYNATEELETELTFSSVTGDRITPYGISLDPSLACGVAFDNFDRYVETASGKDTLHDTVGIAYQDVAPVSIQISTPMPSGRDQNPTAKKRRRRYDSVGSDLEPYYKKPKMRFSNFLALGDARRKFYPSRLNHVKLTDSLWLYSLFFFPDDTPLWVGWNAKISGSDEVYQNIWYLQQIEMSPTSNTAVVHTMKVAQSMAKEMGKPEIAVTYDLAIAKLAMQIQAEESPKFDNLFIFLGQFHTEMAFFNALGKFIADSGGPTILIMSEAIASGSLKGFLTGKHYNRCKRIHVIPAAAMENLLIKQFLSQLPSQDILYQIKDEILNIHNDPFPLHDNRTSIILSREFAEFIGEYENYKENIRTGFKGLTAQYWLLYIDFVALYRLLSRSTREGDFDLYKHSLQALTNLFFSFNQPNYSRWAVRVHDNLLKIEATHPSLAEEFQNGRFGIKRTKKEFSRMPIDLTLEQTINADAASQRTGISSFTNSLAARQRWDEYNFSFTGIT